MGYCKDDNDEPYWWNGTHLQRKKALPADVHLPNKNEAKELRKIMSKTGMTEKEIRTHKKYRKQLADASKRQGTKSRLERFILDVMKSVTRELKLPKEHPDTLKKFFEKLEERKTRGYGYVPHMLRYMTKDSIIGITKRNKK